MVLPAVSLGFNQSALIARIARSCMLEVLQQDYIRTARAKGLSQRAWSSRPRFRNALVPVVTVIGITMAILIGGAVVTEIVFNIPGPRAASSSRRSSGATIRWCRAWCWSPPPPTC